MDHLMVLSDVVTPPHLKGPAPTPPTNLIKIIPYFVIVKSAIVTQSFIRAWSARRAMRQLINIRNVVNEMVATEYFYVQTLHILCMYKSELARIFPKKIIIEMFSNIDELYLFNLSLLLEFEQLMTRWSPYNSQLSALFLNRNFKRVYGPYIANHERAVATINSIMKENLLISTVLDRLRKKHEAIYNMDIYGLIIQPIQRLPRYILLLKELLRSMPLWHTDKLELERAIFLLIDEAVTLNKQQGIVDHINTSIKYDSDRINTIIKTVKPMVNPFMVKQMQFIQEGAIKWYNPLSKKWRPRIYFILSDLILVCKKKKPKSVYIGASRRIRYKQQFAMHVDKTKVIVLNDPDQVFDMIVDNGLVIHILNKCALLFSFDTVEEKTDLVWKLQYRSNIVVNA